MGTAGNLLKIRSSSTETFHLPASPSKNESKRPPEMWTEISEDVNRSNHPEHHLLALSFN
jgi:hypothetical protein